MPPCRAVLTAGVPSEHSVTSHGTRAVAYSSELVPRPRPMCVSTSSHAGCSRGGVLAAGLRDSEAGFRGSVLWMRKACLEQCCPFLLFVTSFPPLDTSWIH